MSKQQTTILAPIQCHGVGLHSGQSIEMKFIPSEADQGIRFVRIDIQDKDNTIEALYSNVSNTTLCTEISNSDGISVGTVEHLMSALRAIGIDNLTIEIDGPEIPVVDGSAEPFTFLMRCAGKKELNQERQRLQILKTVRVEQDDKYVEFSPADSAVFDLTIDFDHDIIGQQHKVFDLNKDNYNYHIGRARTFGFEKDIEQLHAAGLARGGSLDNAVVVGKDNSILNPSGLRFEDEFVRHKILDAVGDLYLAGSQIIGRYKGFKPGHELHHKLLEAVFNDKDSYQMTTL